MSEDLASRVTINVDASIADVRLNRPEKINALDPAMFEALTRAGLRIRDDASVRAVVLSGEGRGFSAGLDFKSFLSEGGSPTLLSRGADSPANRAQRAAWIWQEVPVPVI